MVPILYQDASCVVVNKPAGVASHKGWAHDEDDALLQLVRDQLGQWVYLVNRLDRGASGCVMLALSPEAARAHAEAWAHNDKRYLALTRGAPPPYLMLDHAVPKGPDQPRVDARTEIWCLAAFGRYALVAARPHTGRLHQIRRHLKHLSCPIIGDVRYGKGEHNRYFREHHQLHRLALHGQQLTFTNLEGKRIICVAPVPDDMRRAVLALARG